MKITTLNEAAEWLMGQDDFVILTHRRPDGDAVGSAAALCLGLRSLGKRASILQNPQLTPKMAPFWENLTCEKEGNALLVAVDLASETQFSYSSTHLTQRVLLSIDHHGSNTDYAVRTYVEPDTAACGEIVLRLLRQMSVKIDRRMAEAMYLAISTDTGCFRYSNVTADTLRAAADCRDCGADTFAINQAFFMTKRLARLKLDAYLVRTMELYHGGKVAVNVLPERTLRSFGVVEDDIDNISGFAREIEGVEIAVVVRQTPLGHYGKLSVRTSPRYDASAICAPLGGGGHRAAAGATTQMDMAGAKAAVLQVIDGLFEKA